VASGDDPLSSASGKTRVAPKTDQPTENLFDYVTVLIRRFGARIPAAPCQLDVSPGPGRSGQA
jgi:hypothetical protein